MRITQIIITPTVLIVAGVHLNWPDLKIDLITLMLLLVVVVPRLSQIFKSLELPGGWRIEFHDLQKAKNVLMKLVCFPAKCNLHHCIRFNSLQMRTLIWL